MCCNVVLLYKEVMTIADKTINFKVDEDFYRTIKIKIATVDKTLKNYIIELIEKDLKKDE